MKILLLGQYGMLGNYVFKYLKSNKVSIDTTEYKWPDIKYKEFIKNSDADFLINCVGAIPQKNYNWDMYKNINILFPIFLAETFKSKIIHPSTDCVFKGSSSKFHLYNKNDCQDAIDDYGISKAYISNLLLEYKNVKQIRTSIIGPEINHKRSLMEWFLNQFQPVNGYVDHYWNGITTLEWSKQCLGIINNWDSYDKIVQIGTDPISKYELLMMINNIYKTNKIINKFSTNKIVNKCLKSDYILNDISAQITELYKNELL